MRLQDVLADRTSLSPFDYAEIRAALRGGGK